MSSARFLTELFLHPERISVERREGDSGRLWNSIKLQTQSPTAEEEKEYRKKSDFGMMALNSTRPIGLEAVMRYARWLRLSKPDFEVDGKGLPKVFDLLSNDTSILPSTTLWQYGRCSECSSDSSRGLTGNGSNNNYQHYFQPNPIGFWINLLGMRISGLAIQSLNCFPLCVSDMSEQSMLSTRRRQASMNLIAL